MDAELTPKSEWSIESAEALLNSLRGVVSARVVARPGGIIEEIRLLTEGDVPAKQSVRNVESALLAHFGLKIDHRKVSVAQKDDEQGSVVEAFDYPESRSGERRFLFMAHRVETEKAHRVRIAVTVEWDGEQYEGEASGADRPRARLETTAGATLRAIEPAIVAQLGEGELTLSVDGVKVVDALKTQPTGLSYWVRYKPRTVGSEAEFERRPAGATLIGRPPRRAKSGAETERSDRSF